VAQTLVTEIWISGPHAERGRLKSQNRRKTVGGTLRANQKFSWMQISRRTPAPPRGAQQATLQSLETRIFVFVLSASESGETS
jgi:hypothetical protein